MFLLKLLKDNSNVIVRWLTGVIVSGISYATVKYLDVEIPENRLFELSATVGLIVTGAMGEFWSWLQKKKIINLTEELDVVKQAEDATKKQDAGV